MTTLKDILLLQSIQVWKGRMTGYIELDWFYDYVYEHKAWRTGWGFFTHDWCCDYMYVSLYGQFF